MGCGWQRIRKTKGNQPCRVRSTNAARAVCTPSSYTSASSQAVLDLTPMLNTELYQGQKQTELDAFLGHRATTGRPVGASQGARALGHP